MSIMSLKFYKKNMLTDLLYITSVICQVNLILGKTDSISTCNINISPFQYINPLVQQIKRDMETRRAKRSDIKKRKITTTEKKEADLTSDGKVAF